MVIANTARGLTSSFDLTQAESFAALCDLLASGQVTALSILRDGTQHTLTSPRGMRGHVFGAEPVLNGGGAVVGERVFLQAGDVRVTLSATFGGNVVRTDLVRTGVMRYHPRSTRRSG